MNTCSRWPERGLASGTSSRRVVTTDGCPVSSFLGVRQAAPAQHGEFSLLVADAHCLLVGLLLAGQSRPYPRGGTMATSSSRSRSTDGLQGRGGGSVAEAVRQEIRRRVRLRRNATRKAAHGAQ